MITPLLYLKNIKQHPPAQLYKVALSIKNFGWQQPIKLGMDLYILAGHARWLAYEKYKFEMNLDEPWMINEIGETISGKPSDKKLTEEEEKAYRLADNLLVSTEYDMELVLEEQEQLGLPFQEMLRFEEIDKTEKNEKDEEFINEDGYLKYLNQSIRQIVLHYEQEEFNQIIVKCELLQKKHNCENKSELFKILLNLEYANNISPTEKN